MPRNRHMHLMIKISISRIYRYLNFTNISEYFDKNIDKAKIIQNSQECLKKLQKNNKIS